MLVIDGSQGEGGGQILRTALALSMVTGRSFRIERIRAGRSTPGLLRQHLTAVNAAAEVCGAEINGAVQGSGTLTFQPRAIRPGDYRFAIGTAGSTTLVLQAVLPALLVADGPSTIRLEGGTHNSAAPPFDFLERSFLPLLNRMGPTVTATLDRHGFFPAGGGQIQVTIDPVKQWQPVELLSRGAIRQRSCRILLAGLPEVIARREWQVIATRLNWAVEDLEIVQLPAGHGPGNVLLLELRSETLTEIFTAFGRRGASSEKVASEVVQPVREYLKSDAPVGEYLADQLLLPMALSGRGAFVATHLSSHATTNIDVIRQFLDVAIASEAGPGSVRVSIGS